MLWGPGEALESQCRAGASVGGLAYAKVQRWAGIFSVLCRQLVCVNSPEVLARRAQMGPVGAGW